MMEQIKCRVRLNEYQDSRVKLVTPAEALLLRFMHDGPAHTHSAGAESIEDKNKFWKFIVGAEPAGVAEVQYADPKHEDPETEAPLLSRPRTTQEEVARLRREYNVRGKSNQPGSHIVEDLFPGLSPQLPETFEEIGFIVPEAPAKAEKPKASKASKAKKSEEPPAE